MTNHQKRLSAPDGWPVDRKTETFTVKADAGPHGESGVPLLILLRDVLGYADSRKEARYALNEENVVINGTPVADEERPVGMFDIIAFQEREEYYRVFPDEGGRLALTPIDEDSAQSKLGKIAGKHDVAGGDTQLTLHDGQTLLVENGYGVNDSIVVANDDDEIVAHFEYEEGALATAVAGQHAGQIGTITEIQVTPGSAANNVLLDAHDGEGRFETIEEYVVVIDENFTSDDGDEEADAEEADADEDTDAEDADADETAEDADAEDADADDADADDADADEKAEDADADEKAEDAGADEGADADDADADTEAEADSEDADADAGEDGGQAETDEADEAGDTAEGDAE
jgi:small subunit ribosomal protein S4e